MMEQGETLIVGAYLPGTKTGWAKCALAALFGGVW